MGLSLLDEAKPSPKGFRRRGQRGAPRGGIRFSLHVIKNVQHILILVTEQKAAFMHTQSNVIDLSDSPSIAILKMLRLNPERWECTGIAVEPGSLRMFSDSDPDAPIVETTTDYIRCMDRGSVDIHISSRSGLRHICPNCGKVASIKKYVKHSFDSSPLCGMKTKVSVRVPQLYCHECEVYPVVRCPLVVFNHTYTKLLKLDVLSILSEETVSATASACKIGDGIVFDILNETVEDGKKSQNASNVDTVYLDEFQSTHGHNYITMGADQDHRAVTGVLGHDIKSVEETRDWLQSKGCPPEQIKFVCADMSVAYKSGVKSCFPNAKIIIDHFHLNKAVNEALDTVRKRTNRKLKSDGCEYPKNVKYTVLHRKENQNDLHKERMEEIRLLNPELAKAFDLKEEFFMFFDCEGREVARSRFFTWYNHAKHSKIKEMADVAGRMLKRLNDILRWFDHRISNAVSEGLNNAYKKIKSAAYGYRKPENLIDMCLFRKGRLQVRI